MDAFTEVHVGRKRFAKGTPVVITEPEMIDHPERYNGLSGEVLKSGENLASYQVEVMFSAAQHRLLCALYLLFMLYFDSAFNFTIIRSSIAVKDAAAVGLGIHPVCIWRKGCENSFASCIVILRKCIIDLSVT